MQEILHLKYSDPPSVNGWWERFFFAAPLRTPAPLSFIRADRECLQWYFDLLKATLDDNELLDKSGFIFNCDETGFPLCPKSGRILEQRILVNQLEIQKSK